MQPIAVSIRRQLVASTSKFQQHYSRDCFSGRWFEVLSLHRVETETSKSTRQSYKLVIMRKYFGGDEEIDQGCICICRYDTLSRLPSARIGLKVFDLGWEDQKVICNINFYSV